MDTSARYDGLAEWYDAEFADGDSGRSARAIVLRLLGPGPGKLLDLGCGTGAHTAAFVEAGWDATGVDVSEDQLRLALARGLHVVRADAAALPFNDATFDAAVSIFTHTDMDDFAGAVRETARVLRPGGRFVYLGIHPCFVGPHAFVHDREVPELYPGYRDTSFRREAPGIWSDGVRARVGAWHLPLGLFLHCFLDASLRLERFEEPHGRDYPYIVALRAVR
ncbi:MAG TPA: methyltransferase domain-containing protein [Gaiellaceae bacterium]